MTGNRISIKAIRDRESDPRAEAFARKRADMAAARLDANMPKLMALKAQAMMAGRMADKMRLLNAMFDLVQQCVGRFTPCKSGCASCCHIPVMITQAEADDIGRAIGKPPAATSYTTDPQLQLTGTRCPFLKQNKCSIYARRPSACRLHFIFDSTDLSCRVDHGEVVRQWQMPTKNWQAVVLQVLGLDQYDMLADIRDFFPQGGE